MNAKSRELVQIAEQLGFTFTGHDGAGHLVLVHNESGEQVHLPSTPSEYRGRRNSIAQLERVAGQRLPRPNHRRSHKKNTTTGFNPEAAAQECARWHAAHAEEQAQLEQERAALIKDCEVLAEDRAKLRLIPGRLRAIAKTEERLARLGVQVEPFDPLSLAQ